jgi:hypothetical protein
VKINIDEIVRKLLLLGIPILPTACDNFGSSCPGPAPPPHEEVASIARPTGADGGTPWVTEASFRRCVDEGVCLELCREHFRLSNVQSCTRVPDDAGATNPDAVVVRAQVITICEGRRPEGYGPAGLPATGCELGLWLAQAAHTEALSVPAFARLARELKAHGAPRALVDDARRSAREERRHTRMMTALARRHGVRVARPSAPLPGHVRTLEAIATENAVEGCVRETVGALVARWQAGWARDARIRAAMTVIARDEARHAELAWQVDAWATSRLPGASRQGLAAARAQAFSTLQTEIQQSRPGALLRHAAGVPSASDTLRLARALQTMPATLA